MVGIYVRVSTARQMEKYSPEVQRDKGIEFAKGIGEEYKLFIEAKTGKELEVRHEFKELISNIENKEINKVWVIDFDRLFRNAIDALTLRGLLVANKISVYINDHLEDITDERFLSYGIRAVVAEDERLRILRRTKRGREARYDEGGRWFNFVLGHDKKFNEITGETEWYIVPREAQILKEIFSKYVDGVSLYRIWKDLVDEHVPTKNGGTWSISHIAQILRKPVFMGKTNNSKGILVTSKMYKPIINEETFYKAQKMLKVRARKRWSSHIYRAKYAVTAVVRCELCNAKYKAIKTTKYKPKNPHTKYSGYYRATHIKNCKNANKGYAIHFLDDMLFYATLQSFSPRKRLEPMYKAERQEAIKQDAQNIKKRTNIEKEIDNLEKQQKRLIDAFAKGILSERDISEKMEEVKQRIEANEKELEGITSIVDDVDQRWTQIIYQYRDEQRLALMKGEAIDRRAVYLRLLNKATILHDILKLEYINGWELELNLKDLPEKYRRWHTEYRARLQEEELKGR